MLDLLRADGSIVVNKKLAKKIGLDEAIIYSELASQFNFWSIKAELVDRDCKKNKDGQWFFCTVEKLEEHTTIKKGRQQRTIQSLENLKLIETKKMGLPAKRYFRMTEEIFNIMFDNKFQSTQNEPTDKINGLSTKKEDKSRFNQSTQNEPTSKPEMSRQEEPKQSTINNRFINPLSINNLEEEEAHRLVVSFFKENFEVTNKRIENKFKEWTEILPVNIIMNEIAFTAENGAKSFAYVEKALKEDLALEIDSIDKLEQKRKTHKKKIVNTTRTSGLKKDEKVPSWLLKQKEQRESNKIKEDEISPEYELKRQELFGKLGIASN